MKIEIEIEIIDHCVDNCQTHGQILKIKIIEYCVDSCQTRAMILKAKIRVNVK
jgi:hypothetical protein